MKKYFYLFTLVCSLVILSTSCGDDEPSKRNPLKGTKWVCDNSYAAYIYSGLEGENYVEVWEFVTDTKDRHYFQSVKSGNKESITEGQYEYVNDQYFYFIDDDGKKIMWYFLSPTEFCNNKNKTESWSSVFKKQ